MEMFSNDYVVCMQTDQNENERIWLKNKTVLKHLWHETEISIKSTTVNSSLHFGIINIAQVGGILYMYDTWL